MARWTAFVEVWPYSGVSKGGGAKGDQKLAGDRHLELEVTADDIKKALAKVELFVKGVKTNPAVWEVPIMKIERTGN